MRWTLGVAAAVALVVAAGACSSQITVPDQGIIVTGCQMPSQCFRADCPCTRDTGACTVACTITTPGDPSTCDCLPVTNDGGDSVQTECLEPAQACIGRGVPCPGVGALCKASGACDGTGDPPMLIPTPGNPTLVAHCQFDGDICCPGTILSDGGATTD
ncbi:MAG TPA: hypothetical protein VHB97_26675 [Polyangia bacterium]|jgi:hypothetical protein|nr:hypothetical protein [Polyangia bacterium]